MIVERHQAAEDQLSELLRRIVGGDSRIEVVGAAGDAHDDDVGVLDRPVNAGRDDTGAGAQHRRAQATRLMPRLSFFSAGEQGQRLERRHAIDVDGRDAAGAGRRPALRRLKETELLPRVGSCAADRGPSAARELVVLERRQDFARAVGDRPRQAGQPGHLNAVAAIGSSRHDLVQEDDVVLPLARRDVKVDDAGRARRRDRSARDSAWRRASWAGPSDCVARCSATAQAMLSPSKVAVPRPISSSTTRLRDVAVCRMWAVSCISTMKVDWPRAMLSDAPTRAKMRSTSGTFASRAGTNEPACAIRHTSAVCRR